MEIVDGTLVRGSVAAGTPLQVRVSLANYDPTRGRITLELGADGTVVGERTVAVGASTERTVVLKGRLAEPGEYALDVNGVALGTVAVTERPSETPSERGTDAPGGPPADRPGARGQSSEAATVEVTLPGRSTDRAASADLDESLRSEHVSLERLGVPASDGGDDGTGDSAGTGDTDGGDLGFVVTAPTESVPENARELDTGTAVQYFTLGPSNDSARAYEAVELEFGVNESALPSGTTPEDVVLYHYTDGEWIALPTTYDAANGTYTATVDGFSPFAVGVDSASTDRSGLAATGADTTEAAELSPASEGSVSDVGNGESTVAGTSTDGAVPLLGLVGLVAVLLVVVLFLFRDRSPFGGTDD